LAAETLIIYAVRWFLPREFGKIVKVKVWFQAEHENYCPTWFLTRLYGLFQAGITRLSQQPILSQSGGIPTWFRGESEVTLIVSQVFTYPCNAATIRHETEDRANRDATRRTRRPTARTASVWARDHETPYPLKTRLQFNLSLFGERRRQPGHVSLERPSHCAHAWIRFTPEWIPSFHAFQNVQVCWNDETAPHIPVCTIHAFTGWAKKTHLGSWFGTPSRSV